MKRVTLLTSAFLLGNLALAQAALITFDTDPIADGWYVDRSAPATFESATPSMFGGEHVLHVGIDGSSQPSGSHEWTQGYKLDLDPIVPEGANFISADLYLDPNWASLTSDFRVGLWATGVDAADNITQYPILSFGTEGASSPGEFLFRQFDSNYGAWYDLLTIHTGDLGTWVNLGFKNVGGYTEYFIDGVSVGFDAGNPYDTLKFDNVILQARNLGESYDVYWDNLSVSAVPEPSTFGILGMMGATLIGGFFIRRRRQAQRPAAQA